MTQTKKQRICITGVGGRLGTILARALSGRYLVTGLGRNPGPLVKVRADIGRWETLRGALDGQNAVVHLAAYHFADDNWAEILPANVVGTFNVLEEARLAGVRRFILASSLSVVGGHWKEFVKWHGKKRRSGREKARFLSALDFPRPDSLYGAAKVFAEAVCRYYTDRFGISCVCLRLGEVRPDDRPRAEDPFGYVKMCRQADFVAGVEKALEITRRKSAFRVMTLISDDYQLSR